MLHGERLIPFAIICVLAALATAALALLRAGAVVPLFAAAIVLGFSGAGWNGLMAAALAEVGGADRAASALGLALTAIFLALGDRADGVRRDRRPHVAARRLAGRRGARARRRSRRCSGCARICAHAGAPGPLPRGLNRGRSAPRWRNW